MAKTSKKELVIERFDLASVNTQKKFLKFNECDTIYNGSGKTQSTNAQIHNPYSWGNIETIVPRMVANRPKFLLNPREQGDEDRAKNLTALTDYWANIESTFVKLVSWVKDSQIYGTGIVKVYWKTVEKEVSSYRLGQDGKPVVDEKTGEYIVEKKTVKTFDDPCLENVNIYNFFSDPNADTIQDANWVIHRYWKTIDELKSYDYYKNLDKLERLADNGDLDKSSYDKEREESAYGEQKQEDTTVDLIECLEMWDKDGLTVLAGRSVIIREQENPFWHGKIPYIKLNDSLVPQEFYGKGEIEPILKLQYALDTIQNQVIDYKTQVLQPMWKVKGEIDESELVFEPNGVIHTSDFDDAEILTPSDISNTGVSEMANIKGDIQQALGIYDYTKGNSNTGINSTATGISAIQEAANARFAHKIQLLEEALKEMGSMVVALYQQFITDEKLIRVSGDTGSETLRLSPQDIAGEYDIDVEAGSTRAVNKDTERQDILNLYSLFSTLPLPDLQLEMQKKILDRFDMDDLKQALIKDTQEAQVQQQQMAQMAQEQQVQAQQMAMQQHPTPAPKSPSESINFKDLPPKGQEQLARQAGIDLTAQDFIDHAVNQQVISSLGKAPARPTQSPQMVA